MSPEKRGQFKRKGSSSNHYFSRDMLVFVGVMFPQTSSTSQLLPIRNVNHPISHSHDLHSGESMSAKQTAKPNENRGVEDHCFLVEQLPGAASFR